MISRVNIRPALALSSVLLSIKWGHSPRIVGIPALNTIFCLLSSIHQPSPCIWLKFSLCYASISQLAMLFPWTSSYMLMGILWRSMNTPISWICLIPPTESLTWHQTLQSSLIRLLMYTHASGSGVRTIVDPCTEHLSLTIVLLESCDRGRIFCCPGLHCSGNHRDKCGNRLCCAWIIEKMKDKVLQIWPFST